VRARQIIRCASLAAASIDDAIRDYSQARLSSHFALVHYVLRPTYKQR
jgi:hypothetical protein